MTTDTEQLTPLEMAQNCVNAVRRVGEFQERDPVQAHIQHAGQMGKQSAELAACMALVSIAESLARIVQLAEENDR